MAGQYSEALERKLDFERRFLQQLRTQAGPGAPQVGSEFHAKAEVFFVGADVMPLIMTAASKLPTDVLMTEAMTPSEAGFVWFDRPLEIDTFPISAADRDAGFVPLDEQEVQVQPLHGFEWMITTERLLHVMALMPSPRGGLGELPALSWQLGTTRPQMERLVTTQLGDHAPVFVRVLSKEVAAFFLFVQQKILVALPVPVDRPTRRRAEKAGQVVQPVRVVELRKRERLDAPARDGQGDPVEWSCRWMVRGHWRQQLYPSENQHHPLWIAPYVKGPDNKPVRPPRHQIFAVVR